MRIDSDAILDAKPILAVSTYEQKSYLIKSTPFSCQQHTNLKRVDRHILKEIDKLLNAI